MQQSLLDATYALLDHSTLRRPEIARGAAVGSEWLKKLEARQIEDPSVRRIQRLHDFLKKKQVPSPPTPEPQCQAG